jgi:hypothetical protein
MIHLPSHNTTVNKQTILCRYCHGERTERVFNEDPRYEGPFVIPCQACNGKGLVIRIVKTEYFKIG